MKLEKYDDAVKYVLYHYPGLVPPQDVNPVGDPRLPLQSGRHIKFQSIFGDDPTKDGDLIYGIADARGLGAYHLHNSNGDKVLAQICDHYNNAAKIGTGDIFKRNWQGLGFLDADRDHTEQLIRAQVSWKDMPTQKNSKPILSERFRQYAQGLLNSRYNPMDVHDMATEKIVKDTHKSLDQMMQMYGNNRKLATAHMWAHARMVKAVRRACKGGIVMVAKAPQFKYAHVHFIMDMMGDLGKVAFKKPLRAEYVPITSSELTFVFRYYDELMAKVFFWVNGEAVLPPWVADWKLNDAKGNEVYSNQEAWFRYALYREVTGRDQTPFPEWDVRQKVT